jgi:small subunit ribosomal protein S18
MMASKRSMVKAPVKKVQFFKKRKVCPLANIPNNEISFKNPSFLRKFVSEGGRILPSRITNVSAKKQRLLNKQIKIARVLGLLPFLGIGKK